jgi:hypothetical protein
VGSTQTGRILATIATLMGFGVFAAVYRAAFTGSHYMVSRGLVLSLEAIWVSLAGCGLKGLFLSEGTETPLWTAVKFGWVGHVLGGLAQSLGERLTLWAAFRPDDSVSTFC